MTNPDATAGLPPPPDPPQDRAAKPLPQNIADLLTILGILLAYARHLAATLEYRAAANGFTSVAQFFGTARLAVIRARLARGMLRIRALETVLRARAARGRDLVFLGRREPAPRTPKPAPPTGETPAGADADAGPQRRPRRPRPPGAEAAPDPANLPSLEQLVAEIRRRPIGAAVADICRDLGVAPSLCEGRLWDALFNAITWYRGDLHRLIVDFRRREVAIDPEVDRDPNLGLPARSRAVIGRALGFFIGQEPVTPFWVPVPPDLAAAATGPP
jgi:hypothetical protein